MTERETGHDSNKKIRKEVNYNNRRWLIKFEEAKGEMGEIRGKISNQKRLKETFAEYVCINYTRSPRMKVIKRSEKENFPRDIIILTQFPVPTCDK